jgi:hypothetical protein
MQRSRIGKKLSVKERGTLLYLGAPSSADRISGTTPARRRQRCQTARRRRVAFAMLPQGRIVSRPCRGCTNVRAENALFVSRGCQMYFKVET